MPYIARMLAALVLVAAPLAQAQDANQARNLAATCTGCHGNDGHARGGAIRPLAGLPAETITALMTDYKSGALPATIMHQIAKGYTDGQIKQIAAFFASQQARK